MHVPTTVYRGGIISLLLVLTILSYADSPEDFLYQLCDNRSGTEGALFWSDMASAAVDSLLSHPDTLAMRLSTMRDLSVEPGPRTLFETTENGYRVEFAESAWTWTGDDGRLHRVNGLTGIDWTAEGYRWYRIIFLVSGSVSIGRKERMVTGLLVTVLILVFGAILLGWAKRKYPI